jgi:hypothetical protein
LKLSKKGGGNLAKVTDEIISIIVGLSATQSNREIVETLSKSNIKLSHVTVGKIVNENRQERTAQTKEAVNEYIKKTVVTDLEILEQQRDKLYQWFNDDNLRVTERLMCSDRLNKVIDTRLKYSGADEQDEDKKINIIFGIPRPPKD